ncbi:hypothetical protein [Streptomyces sp. NBC_01353]|uniref:hypothetical protein n=1 Tax=Streptomyces sp. NBC_01353 TaxID=2903835 RepID=UPI002E3511B9|nr:hypothetical protein [Streptomyces sp. NBC_01353]
MKRRALAALGLMVLVAACSPTGEEKEQSGKERVVPKMDMQEAADRADKILDDTFAAITPPVQWTHRQTMAGNCSTDRKRTVMTIISEERRSAFLGVVDRHWRSKGFTFRATSKDKLSAYYWTPDGFQVNVQIGWKGQAHLEVTTPCVDPSDVAAPTAPPNGHDYSKQPPTAPNVTSDFWSVKAPAPGASATPSS